MATTNSFPPDVPRDAGNVPRDAGEAGETADTTVRSLRNKAADMADRASETVKEGYERARDAWDEAEPMEAIREGGEAVARHPLAVFGLGALSLGLIAWATLRPQPWERQPAYSRWRGWLNDYGEEAAAAGQRALKSGGKWLGVQRDAADDYADRASGYAADYAARARDYADMGGRMLARRAEREPMAALLGLGLAVYVIGSLLSSTASSASGTASAPAASRAPARKRSTRR